MQLMHGRRLIKPMTRFDGCEIWPDECWNSFLKCQQI